MGPLFQPNAHNITGQDGATSIPLPAGGALWLFGDTIEGEFRSIRGLSLADKLSNTAAVVPAQRARQGLTPFNFLTTTDSQRPREVIPFHSDESRAKERLWPMHGTCVGEHIFVFYHRISLLPGVDVFENFKLEGMGLARARIGEWRFERLSSPAGLREFWTGDQPTFGVFVTPNENFLYVWGSLMTGMFLARTSPASISDSSSYEYLVSAPTLDEPQHHVRWSRRFAPSAPLFDSVPNEMSAVYNRYLRCYVALHTYLRDHQIVIRTAPQITGPWSGPTVIYEPPKLTDADLIYAAKEHPELAEDNGRIIYFTYVNSSTYQPQLVEVTFP